jgi:hypothetical protein
MDYNYPGIRAVNNPAKPILLSIAVSEPVHTFQSFGKTRWGKKIFGRATAKPPERTSS